MSVIERIHGGYVYKRRVRVLSAHLAKLLSPGASILDVGCGDGMLAQAIVTRRPDIELRGVDVLVRPKTFIPVDSFDGTVIPYQDASFDIVMFVDVLHHTRNPMVLLHEGARVARGSILIKDHLNDGICAGPTLRFMDWIGNARHGVALTYNYWSRRRWYEMFDSLGLTIGAWETALELYPPWLNWIFGRSLHFIARLDVAR